MQLFINTPGAKLRKSGGLIEVTTDENKEQYACNKINQIVISTSASLTTDVLELAMENNIDVVFLKRNGSPFGRVWYSKLGSISTIRRLQLKLTDIPMGTILIKEWIGQKLHNQIKHLEKLKLNRTGEKVCTLDNAISRIEKLRQNVISVENKPIASVRNTIEGFEGTAGRCYFGALGAVIPEQYTFSGRNKNPSEDMFNCMLNYAYAILYSNVEKACILSGLDPYIGIMHVDNYNKTSMVFDIIEMYRGYMDEVVFKLFSKRLVRKEMFDIEKSSYWLNREGKQLLIQQINERLSEKIRYKGKLTVLKNIIELDCHSIANKILEEAEQNAGLGCV